MDWRRLSKSDKRSVVSRKHLESAVTKVVKSVLDCEAFVGVIIQRIEPKSRTDPNWAVRGVRFGKADRDKSGKVLATRPAPERELQMPRRQQRRRQSI